MVTDKKDLRPKLDLEAEALAALEQARTISPGPERTEAMKKAEVLRLSSRASFLPSAAGRRKPEWLAPRGTRLVCGDDRRSVAACCNDDHGLELFTTVRVSTRATKARPSRRAATFVIFQFRLS
jgi:hypothetical protein